MNIEIANRLQKLRKENGYSQEELADKLGISRQAVSKWETGENLPDTALLLDLCEELDTTCDKLLNGGLTTIRRGRLINPENIVLGFKNLLSLRDCFGEDSLFFIGAIEGINNKMNMNILEHLKNDHEREVLYTEAILQMLQKDCYVKIDEVKEIIHNEKMIKIIEKFNH